MHHAAVPATGLVGVNGAEPEGQSVRMHPRVLIHLENELGLDVLKSPLQSMAKGEAGGESWRYHYLSAAARARW